jgi:hypothetical protein
MIAMKREATWTVLVHGFAKVGKSWLLDTVPGPRLILDVEGRAHFTPSEPKVYWDPKSGPPPVADGWQTCVAPVPDFETLVVAHRYLRQGGHPFKSVGVDSLMEAQKRSKDVIRPGTESLQTQDWGALLRQLEKLVREYRDLTHVPETGVRVVAMLSGSRQSDSGPKEPNLEGAIRDSAPYFFDTVGYLYKQQREDGSLARGLLVDQQPGFVAGDGTNRIITAHGPVVWDPDMSALYDLMREEK